MEENTNANPFIQFDIWFKDVCTHKNLRYEETNSVCLSTCADNKPSSRMVLLKKYDKDGFSFFTNNVSRKGQQIAANPNAAMLFYWPFVNRQVRIEGQIQALPIEEVEDYWNSRPLNSRIGAAISVQSSVIPSRNVGCSS
jgi:pyridoxamine-phosphate oxidase